MKRSKNFKALARAIGIVSAVVIIVSGVTFAALQSQQDTLVGNTIETATANLQLSIDGISFGNSRTGFDFNNLIPGGPAQPATGYTLYLRNSGGTPLSLRLAISSLPSNLANIDLSKVNVVLTPPGSGSSPQSFSLQSLVAGSSNGGVVLTGDILPGSTTQQYKLQVSMNSDAVIGSSASLGNIDFAFSGLVQGG